MTRVGVALLFALLVAMLAAEIDPSSRLQFSAEQAGHGPAFFAAADQHGLEGIVSKLADSRYVSGRAKLG